MGEQFRPFENGKLGESAELFEHRARSGDRKERIAITPGEQDGNANRSVEGFELVDPGEIKGCEHPRGVRLRFKNRLDEEVVEFASQVSLVGKTVSEAQRRFANEPRSQREAQGRSAERQPSSGGVEADEPRDGAGHFGVAQNQGGHPSITRRDQPRDESPAVVSEQCVSVETDRFGCAVQSLGMGANVERRVRGAHRVTASGKIDQVAREVVGEERDDFAKRRRMQRPAVHEHEIGSSSDLPVREPAVTDIDEAVGLA